MQDEGLSAMEDHTGRKGDGKDDNRLQDMDEDSSGDEGDSQPLIQPPMPPAPDKVLVKKYDPKQGIFITLHTNLDLQLIYVFFLLFFMRIFSKMTNKQCEELRELYTYI